MRLISQDMKNDIPYDQACLYVEECDGMYQIEAFVPNNENYIVMGKYENVEEALEVMDEILHRYTDDLHWFSFPDYRKKVINV